jgi:aspartyl-tRNA(Asn)/glutamyl-tRNA(Gln) amidotransferase subunit A
VVTRAALERIAAWDEKINAMYVVDEVAARAQASLSEARWRAGETLSPLDGVPITIKDNIPVKGSPTLVGTANC